MILTSILLVPLVSAVLLLVNPVKKLVRPIALLSSVITFGLSLLALYRFDLTSEKLQFVEKYPWIESFGINYFLGVDGLSILLVVLTGFLVPIIVVSSWNHYKERALAFHVCLLLLQCFVLGSFISFDLVLFYTFWELSLVPMYLIIGIWGGKKRIYATVKFFIFTMSGSVLMLLAIITLLYMTKSQLGQYSASLLDIYQLNITYIKSAWMSPQTLMFAAFSLAFAIKVPMFPFHSWLPDAHTEAPTAGSVILAGVMLKMGTYGLLRFAIPLFPEVVLDWSWLFMFLGIVGIIYGSLVAMVQTDLKKLVAFSSVAHMGYIVMGLFSLNIYGMTGSLYQMLNHGISTGALFLLVGMIYERTNSREISKYGGLSKIMPKFSICFFIVTLSSIAVPGTNGFVGEFLILMGAFGANNVFGILAVVGVVLGAVYMLWMFKKVFFGELSPMLKALDEKSQLKDISLRESAILGVLVLMIFWMGILPGHFMKYSEASLVHLSENLSSYSLEADEASAGRR